MSERAADLVAKAEEWGDRQKMMVVLRAVILIQLILRLGREQVLCA